VIWSANCQSLETDSVKISYEELRYFMQADNTKQYCDTILPKKDSIIELKEVQIQTLEYKVKKKNFNIFQGAVGGVLLGLLISIVI